MTSGINQGLACLREHGHPCTALMATQLILSLGLSLRNDSLRQGGQIVNRTRQQAENCLCITDTSADNRPEMNDHALSGVVIVICRLAPTS